jgi:hypothetical protein
MYFFDGTNLMISTNCFPFFASATYWIQITP